MAKRAKRRRVYDYQKKKLKNPFYRQEKQIKHRVGKIWLVLLILLSLGGISYLLLFSNFFIIKKIEISGLTRVDETEIKNLVETQTEKSRLLFFRQNNLLLFNTQDLVDLIQADYNFAEFRLTKNYPSTIKIKIGERPYAFIFKNDGELYFASADAYLITDQTVTEDDLANYFLLENKSDRIRVSATKKINLAPEKLNFIFRLNEALSYQDDLILEQYSLEQELNTLIVKFRDGPIVYFNFDKDPIIQFEDLTIVKKENIRDNFNKIKYIDLRYGDKIYYN